MCRNETRQSDLEVTGWKGCQDWEAKSSVECFPTMLLLGMGNADGSPHRWTLDFHQGMSGQHGDQPHMPAQPQNASKLCT